MSRTSSKLSQGFPVDVLLHRQLQRAALAAVNTLPKKKIDSIFLSFQSVLKYLNANLYAHFEIRNGPEVEGRILTTCPALTNTSFPRSSQQMVHRQSSLCLVSYFLTKSESLVPQF